VDIQFIASLSNIRALRRPALILILILIPLHLASLVPRHHLPMPSSIDFPSSFPDIATPINQWNSSRTILVLSKSLQFETNRYVWFVC
jgi:hypothetical protein